MNIELKKCSKTGLFLPFTLLGNQVLTTDKKSFHFNLDYEEYDTWKLTNFFNRKYPIYVFQNSSHQTRYMTLPNFFNAIKAGDMMAGEITGPFKFQKINKIISGYLDG